MAPSPENDNTPKAPDKNDKDPLLTSSSTTTTTIITDNRNHQHHNNNNNGNGNVDLDGKEPSVVGLNDSELKALLDEALTYKSPRDREGKSALFNNLLQKEEDKLRTERATSASGSEQVRYYNTTATRRHRHKRQPSSISENLSHGGSLNNLAKEELYEAANQLQKPKKTVSARQREGGSLPCNVNIPGSYYDRTFFEEERRKKEKQKAEYTVIDMESESLLEHDALNQTFIIDSDNENNKKVPVKYTSRATIDIGSVDEGVTLPSLERGEKNITDHESFKELKKYSFLPTIPPQQWYFESRPNDKKVDENGNALNQNNSETKKNKKEKRDKNVVLIKSENVAGHRSDIINDVDKLMEYIGGNEDGSNKPKSNVHKSKLHKHSSNEEKTINKKQRTRSKAKNDNIQKSTSMEEISITKLEDFNFSQDNENKVPLRSTKSNSERPRERRSWGNSDPIQFQTLQLYTNASAENLESADFRVVTKKKKSKKRRNSVSGRRQPYSSDPHNAEFNQNQSPDLRRKSACSVPHSEKSNDSSDVDSVHSLPIDTNCISRNTDSLNNDINHPISYADIAKNCNSLERPKWNRPPSERKIEKNGEKQIKVIEKVPLKNLTNDVNSTNSIESIDKSTKQIQTTITNVNPIIITNNNNNNNNNTSIAISEIQPLQVTPLVITSSPAQNSTPTLTKTFSSPAAMNTINNNNSNDKQTTTPKPPKSSPNNSANDVSYTQNWPCINKSSEGKTKNQNSIKTTRNGNNNIKNMKNTQISTKTNQTTTTTTTTKNNNNSIINSKIPNEEMLQQHQQQQQQSVYIYRQQNMPTNIPDVSTIEKMHFQQLQNNNHNNNNSNNANNNQFTSSSSSLVMNHVSESTQCNNHLPFNNTIFNNNSINNVVVVNDKITSNCNVVVAVTNEEQINFSEQLKNINESTTNNNNNNNTTTSNNNNQCHVNITNDNNNKKLGNNNNCTNDKSLLNVCDNDRTRPAVVILSGDTGKDVTGITFGFDINEQLLCGDVCSDFISRYIMPDAAIHSKLFNHEKVVNFIGNAWEDVMNESNGKVRYYEEV